MEPSAVMDHGGRGRTPCVHGASFSFGIGVTVTVGRGQTILVEGDRADHFHRVLSGTVRLYKSLADGRRQVIDFLDQGEVFGLTGGERHPYSVEAITSVILIRYSRRALEAAIDHDAAVARAAFDLACWELHRAQQHMLLLGRKTAEERVASFLLRLADGCPGARLVSLPMSRQDIADHLGLTIETVSRTITRLRRAGLISLAGRQLVRLDRPERLRALAEDGSEIRPARWTGAAPYGRLGAAH